jgi:uncharacterized protein Yka (UPF0111/DUF47 family)
MFQTEYSKPRYLKSILTNAPLIDKNIRDEMEESVLKYGAFHSFHEAYGVLKEEVDELWDEIKIREHDYDKIYQEAIQVAAMARKIALCASFGVYV